jgi:membrane protein implicated in regulation of membrane protease activity
VDFLPYIWLLAGVLLIGLELLTPGFVVVFFGIGALITGILSLIIPGMSNSLLAQFLTWAASSLLSLALLRRFFKKTFGGKEITDDGSDEYVGQTAEVVEAITQKKPGRVSFQGTTWKAITYDEDIAPGDTVEIMKKDNLTLVVSKRD